MRTAAYDALTTNPPRDLAHHTFAPAARKRLNRRAARRAARMTVADWMLYE
jgi:hypothetical protein